VTNRFQAFLKNWLQDRIIRNVVKNSGYLFSSNTITMLLGMLQSILAARLLGVAGFGILGGVTAFASTVNRLLSFRMGEVVVKYMSNYLIDQKREHAAAIVKFALLVEAATSVIAYLLLILISPLAARYLLHDPTLDYLIVIYGLSLLANLVTETMTGVLQVGTHFKSQAVVNVLQSALTATLILIAFLTDGDLMLVLMAYLAGKALNAAGIVVVGLRRLAQSLGKDWWKASFRLLPERRALWQYAVSTNLSGTINLVIRDSEVLWVTYFLSPLEAGYYKVALAVINLVLMPITPFISTTFPEISRNIAAKAWQQLRNLLRKITAISLAWTGAVAIGLLILGKWLIETFYGVEYIPAYPALMVLLIGFGFANVLFWNRPLLLSLGLPVYPLKVSFWVGLAKVVGSFWLVPRYGYVAEALLLSLYFVISIGLIVLRGYKNVRHAEAASISGEVV
jgi:O-antigen/teichoic acid export membrane protein